MPIIGCIQILVHEMRLLGLVENLRWIGLLFVVSLSAITVTLLNPAERYFVAEDQLLVDEKFLHGAKFWKSHGSCGVVFREDTAILTNSAMDGSHRLKQQLCTALQTDSYFRSPWAL